MEPIENQLAVHADIYLLLAALLRNVPSEEMLAFIAQIELQQPADLLTGQEEAPMTRAWLELKVAAAQASLSELEDEFQELFIGLGLGEVVPFASWHLTGALMEWPLAIVRQDMGELGLAREEGVIEPEDHIAALFEIMSYLISEARPQQNLFFNRHIAGWYEKLIRQINQAPHSRFYLAVAQLMEQFLLVEKVRLSDAMLSRRNTTRIDVKNLTDSAQRS